ncbi:hypothetical protein B9Z45_07700 [Limnohabitans sp. 2KL-17]|uniref:hypothetical protein n=1 Tax=Limnohabitans sp. 2KL-17 TaxID=1100704 RepID=UPI000D363C35|nr:hypothetical protein [Limnohabitans sp. 2KL-17]PUE57965.1 hypothetical protein B9Z45_07700 [Limnohabitans sp. 2KL-17]
MKKNTVIRNDSPHAVKLREGSNVAERKVKKVAVAKEDAAKPDVKLMAKLATEVRPVAAKMPKPSAAKARPSVRLKSPPTPAAPAPAAITAPTILDEDALWEQDNPVKSRLAQLRTRNALLDEQLQRLKSPIHARGNKS